MGCITNIVFAVIYYAMLLFGPPVWLVSIYAAIWLFSCFFAPSYFRMGYEESDEFEEGLINLVIAFLLFVFPFIA